MTTPKGDNGLLSKVVRFVTNPTTAWTELDAQDEARESGYSKQMLKEMIERKRRNDFVRRREFDMLRKLRRSEVAAGNDPAARPSFFQSSMPSRPDDRASTLKKIDEIEAQMSQQWWKTNNADSSRAAGFVLSAHVPPNAAGRPSRPAEGQEGAHTGALGSGFTDMDAFPTLRETLPGSAPMTVPATLPGTVAGELGTAAQATQRSDLPAVPHASDAVHTARAAQAAHMPTVPGLHMQSASPASAEAQTSAEARTSPAELPPLAWVAEAPVQRRAVPAPAAAPAVAATPPSARPGAGPAGASAFADSQESLSPATAFTPSRSAAVDVEEMAHDPELEEAAIQFAHGDDASAEAGLLAMLAPGRIRANHADSWLTLFDLYRASGQQARFDDAAMEFADRFGRSAPQWISFPDLAGQATPGAAAAPVARAATADWTCPSTLGTQTLAVLQALTARSPQPWRLSWERIQHIDDAAVEGFTRLLAQWNSQAVQLQFIGAAKLEQLLTARTFAGDRTTPPMWWKLRLEALRLMHRPDEFELVALDYCVTYEVSPPSWESPRCRYKALQADGSEGTGPSTLAAYTYADSQPSMPGSPDDSRLGASSRLHIAPAGELVGNVQGDPAELLRKLEQRLLGADTLIISCARLVRIDFTAAGNLLNWVTLREAEGREVRFTDVHRMVAAFFNVVGIAAQAKVLVRRD